MGNSDVEEKIDSCESAVFTTFAYQYLRRIMYVRVFLRMHVSTISQRRIPLESISESTYSVQVCTPYMLVLITGADTTE